MLFWFFSEIRFKFTDLDQIGEFAPSHQIQLFIFGATIMSANEYVQIKSPDCSSVLPKRMALTHLMVQVY
jgi:hypothetical protein